jgi:hypothetical protein
MAHTSFLERRRPFIHNLAKIRGDICICSIYLDLDTEVLRWRSCVSFVLIGAVVQYHLLNVAQCRKHAYVKADCKNYPTDLQYPSLGVFLPVLREW